MNHCTNCTAVLPEGTGRQFGTAWLDDDCLATLATRGYLVGIDRTGGPGHPAITPLSFQRNGHLVTYLAPANYWQNFCHFRFMEPHIQAWLESLPDSELQPFKDRKDKEP